MDSKDIEGIVNANEELELGSVVAGNGTNNTKDKRSPGRDKARARSNGNKTSNNTRAEAHGRPLALQAVVEQTPGHTSDRCGKVSDNGGHDSAEVSRESRASIETEPSNPEEDCANDDMRDVVRAVVELVGSVTATLAQHQGVGQGSRSGSNVDGGTTGIVKTSEFVYPACRVPCPAGNGVVDDGAPDEHEDNTGEHAATLGDSTDCESNTNCEDIVSVISFAVLTLCNTHVMAANMPWKMANRRSGTLLLPTDGAARTLRKPKFSRSPIYLPAEWEKASE